MEKINLDDLKDAASAHLSVAEICLHLDILEDEFWLCYFNNRRVREVFDAARLSVKVEVRLSLFELAKNGSQPAILESLKIVKEIENKDRIAKEEANIFFQNLGEEIDRDIEDTEFELI